MKIPKEIVELAVQGGYKAKVEWVIKLPEYALYQIICDPTFWQALGKSLGWFPSIYEVHHDIARDFFNLLMQQKPTDIFWEELLGNK